MRDCGELRAREILSLPVALKRISRKLLNLRVRGDLRKNAHDLGVWSRISSSIERDVGAEGPLKDFVGLLFWFPYQDSIQDFGPCPALAFGCNVQQTPKAFTLNPKSSQLGPYITILTNPIAI